jgi:hypothetical protein
LPLTASRITFVINTSGHYPIAVGFAITDARSEEQQAVLAAYAGDDTRLAAYATSSLDFRPVWTGGVRNPATDQFIGFKSAQGIAYIDTFHIRGIDHLQRFYPVPEPTALGLLGTSLLLNRRRRRAKS